MKTEFEVRFLGIVEKEIIKKLESLGATFVGDWFQVRNVYDFTPKIPNQWVRLRTNGETTTLTIKEIKAETVDGTKELEIEVSDFATTDAILNKLGYVARAREENKRKRYILDGVEIDIDTWPLIPTFIEIEAESEEQIKDICKKLGLDYSKACTLNVMAIHSEIYGVDLFTKKSVF